MIRFIKLIQDSDLATGLLLLFVASFSYAGVADNIWLYRLGVSINVVLSIV
jgi:hypothetical protein